MIRYKIHPSYVRFPEYDIAIIETERIDNSSFVPICLTDAKTSLLGRCGYVISYTPIKGNDDDKPLLYGHKFSTVHRSYCQKVVLNVPIHTFCVNQGDQGSYFCRGDSGSGFMVRHEVQNQNSKRYFLRGLVSTGSVNDTCTIEDYVIFTDVTKMLAFVTED